MSVRTHGDPVGLVRLSERIVVTLAVLLAVGGAIGVGLGHLLAAGVELLIEHFAPSGGAT